jgi:excisionase family DNA binding protein
MSAYVTQQLEQSAQLLHVKPKLTQPAGDVSAFSADEANVIYQLLDCFVERVAAAVAERIATQQPASERDEWLDSQEAAHYLGLHRDTLRRLAAARVIPAEQDGRGCKLFFHRAALDEWRRAGRRVRHLATAADAA